jgi:hypothetical protein
MRAIPIPSWGAGEMMVKAKPRLKKLGWKQSSRSPRLDCIEKDFNGITVHTIWAGDDLLLSAHKTGFDPDTLASFVRDEDEVMAQSEKDMIPIFDSIVKRNKKRWDKEIKQYEERNNLTFTRSRKYGV